MKFFSLSLCLSVLMSSNTVFATSHDDLKERFAEARLLAARMVREIDVTQLDFTHLPELEHRERVTVWYQANRKELVSDILVSKHIWPAEQPSTVEKDLAIQQSCGKTSHQRYADIMFAPLKCPIETYTLYEAAKLLIGESAHHFPQVVEGKSSVVGDEFSDWVKRAVYDGWLIAHTQDQGGEEDIVTAKQGQQPPLATGLFESSSFKGLLIINGDGKIHLGNDPHAYAGIEVIYNIKTKEGNPNGMLKKMEPRGGTGSNKALEEQRLQWNPTNKRYETKAIMAFTGSMIYDLGVAYRGPYQCTTGIEVFVNPLKGGKLVNLTLRRPRKIESKDCKVHGVIEEYIGFKRIGEIKGL